VSNLIKFSLKDWVVRTRTNELVNDLVNLDRVRSLVKSTSDRQQLLAMREEARGSTAQHGVILTYPFLS
jgi:voltage-dependent calcium channel